MFRDLHQNRVHVQIKDRFPKVGRRDFVFPKFIFNGIICFRQNTTLLEPFVKNIRTRISLRQLCLNVCETALEEEPTALEVHQKNALLELHDIDCMMDLPPSLNVGRSDRFGHLRFFA